MRPRFTALRPGGSVKHEDRHTASVSGLDDDRNISLTRYAGDRVVVIVGADEAGRCFPGCGS